MPHFVTSTKYRPVRNGLRRTDAQSTEVVPQPFLESFANSKIGKTTLGRTLVEAAYSLTKK